MGALSRTPAAAAPQAPQDAPAIHFAASGRFAFASARITVDVRLQEGARLGVTLTPPSGASRGLSLTRAGNRFSWTGQLAEAGVWRAEATVSGAGPSQSAGATVSIEEGAPTCSVTVDAPEQPTHYLTAEFVADGCGAAAVTGEIATRYITVLQDGVQIASMDASDRCERRFILPGGGAYEAKLTVADDRGVTATCSSTDLEVDALYPRFWPTADLATGLYNSERPDVANDVSGTAWLGGGGIGLTVPHDAAADTTNTLTVRAGGGFAHNFWLGSSLDLLLTRQTPGGFFGAGAGVRGTPALRAAHQRTPEQLLRSHRAPPELQAVAQTPGPLARLALAPRRSQPYAPSRTRISLAVGLRGVATGAARRTCRSGWRSGSPAVRDTCR